jgi:hypothetical protein
MIRAAAPLSEEREERMNIGNFIGVWYIQWRDGVEGHGIQQSWTLRIGTNSEYGDPKPFLSADYEVCVGFAMLDEQGVVQLSTEPPAEGVPAVPQDRERSQQDLALVLTGEQLRWSGDYEQLPLEIYVTAAQTIDAGRKTVHLYGSSTYGDPEQMAVWGGSGTPPPPPSPKEGGS